MKATLFLSGVFALAATASPIFSSTEARDSSADPAGDALHIIDNDVSTKLGVGQIVDGATGNPKRDGKSPVSSMDELLSSLQITVTKITSQAGNIDDILSKVKTGDMSKDEAADKVASQFSATHFQLTELVTELTGAAGIPVAGSDVDKVLNLVTILLNEVLTVVKTVVTMLGLRPQLVSLLHSVFNLLAEVLTLLIALVPGLVTPLVAALSPLLAGLGNGLLAPILTPVVGLLASLTAAGNL